MEPMPFAGFNPKPSTWGYNWTAESISVEPPRSSPTSRSNGPQLSPVTNNHHPSPCESPVMPDQYANLPAALLSSLKREKKPFTYTPGGVNLSEVLNARLQKRMERKKKSAMMSPYENNRTHSASPVESPPTPNFDPPKQVIVMPTYNTPLDMYSMENALEALEVQAELAVKDKNDFSPSRSATLPRNHTFRFEEKDFDSNKNVLQSKAFRVLQIITDTEEEPAINDRSKPHQDEMRFTGIRETKAIPSKFFHNLQRITGTEEDEEGDYENSVPRDMERMGAPKLTVYDKQATSRPGFLPGNPRPASQGPQSAQKPAYPQNPPASQFQPINKHLLIEDEQRNSPALRRPAAFLPARFDVTTNRGVNPVHPQFLANGPSRQVFNLSVGTDF